MSERRASAVTKNECPISLASFRALKLKGRNSISRWGRRCGDGARGQLAVSELRGDPLHLLVGEGGRSESGVGAAGVEGKGKGEDIALVMILGRRRRWHIFLALRDDLWWRRRVPLELE